MVSPPTAPSTVRFGVFELDLSARELRKQGRAIKLQDQPFQVLSLLVQRPGQVITREELQKRLWPADTFVEFDQGLNTAIKKIRVALGDSADNPRFVETIPRQGYRFIAPVSGDAGPASGVVPAAPRRRRLLWALVVVAGVVIAGGASAWFWSANRTPEPAEPVPLTSYPGWERSPSFSPDGTRVAFVWCREINGVYKGGIYVKLIGTDEPVPLFRDLGNEYSPAWSPDGLTIAFLRPLPNGRRGVFLMPAIGGAESKIAEIEDLFDLQMTEIAWHPGSKWLVVADRENPDQPFALFLLSVGTGAKRRLTSPPSPIYGDLCPAVSPDGRLLAFSRIVTSSNGDLFLLGLSEDLMPSATEPRRLTFENNFAFGAAWTPNSRSVIYSSGTGHSPFLTELTVSGTGLRPGQPRHLPFAPRAAGNPAVSRQGSLAYSIGDAGANIWRLELNGTPTVKTGTKFIASTHWDHTPRYSPDGKRIAFASNRSGSHEIWVCNSDGSGIRQLTSFGGTRYAAYPIWTPDSRQIVFDYVPEARREIRIIDSDGGTPKRVGSDLASGHPDGWSRDGNWVYFDSSSAGKLEIWKMPAGGGQAKQVTRGGGFAQGASESPDGRFLYYLKTGDEKASLWKVSVDGGEETQVLPSVCCLNVAVTDSGIYFVPGSQNKVQFLDFATGKVVTISNLTGLAAYGLSVSPDRRWLLYTQYEFRGADLMLVEHFR